MISNRLKLSFKRYAHYYILSIILLIIIILLIVFAIKSDIDNKKNMYDFTYYEEIIKDIYNNNPTFFKFDSTNKAIVKIDDLINQYNSNNVNYISSTTIKLTKEQDQCMGYIIVSKINNKLDINTSHICDMIDF